MTNTPLSVAVGIVVHEGKVLLITRPDGHYEGLWSLPGGKIETAEHIGEAAVRELLEETGIQTTVKEYLGVVSEHLIEHDQIQKHFLLHIVALTPITTRIVPQEGEGEPRWFALTELEQIHEDIIPSDYAMIKHFVQQEHPKRYIECVIEKRAKAHELRTFG